MIHVKVIQAQNLPVHTKTIRKTRIYCFSSSGFPYFYDSFKSRENTTNPKWNGEFDAYLFRCSTLSFILYSSRLLAPEVFLGRVDIDLSDFLRQESGNDILSSPQSTIQCNFPIASCTSSNASLSLSFSYRPIIYHPIQFPLIPTPILYLWSTYSPLPENNSVEIEFLQAYITKDSKSGNLQGIYYNFNKLTSWEAVGASSSDKFCYSEFGLTQVQTFVPKLIDSKYEFFIVNNSNYKGVVTLNFFAERDGGIKVVHDQKYILPRKRQIKNGIIKVVDVYCEPNRKYCVPLFLHYNKEIDKKETCELVTFSSIEYDKSDTSAKDIYSRIIEEAKSNISSFQNVTFSRSFVMNNSEKISLLKIFQELNLNSSFNLRVYIGGCTESTEEIVKDTDFWDLEFLIYDKKNDQRCHDVEKMLTKDPNLVFPHFNNDKPFFGMKWNSYVNLNLENLDINNVIVVAIHCDATLMSATQNGFYLISQINGEVENLLFRNIVVADKNNSHFLVPFRFEFVNDGWEIFPMRYYFAKRSKMNSVIDSLFANHWVMPEIYEHPANPQIFESSEDEKYIDTA